jgi:hypothetical protein
MGDFRSGVAYFGVRNPQWVARDMAAIRQRGLNAVLHTCSEEDLKYYPKTLKEIIHISASEGLSVYVNPWGVGRVFGGEAYTELAARNPKMAQISNTGERLVAACPNSPEFKSYMKTWVEAVCDTEAEIIFWDEPHFYFEKQNPDLQSCFCEHCRALASREDGIIAFLDEMTQYVKQQGAGKRNSVCLLPPWFPAGIQDWERVASLRAVDEIASDPYWEKGDSLEQVQKAYTEVSQKVAYLAHAHHKDAQMWIKNYHIEAGTEHYVSEATRIAADAGIRSIFAWSYLGSAYMDLLASDAPELVWETQVKAFEELRGTPH